MVTKREKGKMTPKCKSIEELGLSKQDTTFSFQKEKWFWKKKDGTLFPYYKEEINKKINIFKPETFLPILKELDVPFLEEEWLMTIEQSIRKKNLSNIFGKYLAKMKLCSFRCMGFSNSRFSCENLETLEYIPKITFKSVIEKIEEI